MRKNFQTLIGNGMNFQILQSFETQHFFFSFLSRLSSKWLWPVGLVGGRPSHFSTNFISLCNSAGSHLWSSRTASLSKAFEAKKILIFWNIKWLHKVTTKISSLWRYLLSRDVTLITMSWLASNEPSAPSSLESETYLYIIRPTQSKSSSRWTSSNWKVCSYLQTFSQVINLAPPCVSWPSSQETTAVKGPCNAPTHLSYIYCLATLPFPSNLSQPCPGVY